MLFAHIRIFRIFHDKQNLTDTDLAEIKCNF